MHAPAHPRDVYQIWTAKSAAEAAFLDALERGRLHHAWLLTGPEGVGKATLAYRMARRLLGARPDPSHGLLGAAPSDVVSRQVAARSHPDLMVLERADRRRQGPQVHSGRRGPRLPEFFANSPAVSPYRVAIIDAADDLNVNAANAVLKTLEEPPARGVILLISHAPGKLAADHPLAMPASGRARAGRRGRRRAMVERMADVSGSPRRRAPGPDGPRRARQGPATGRCKGAIALDDAANEILRALPKPRRGRAAGHDRHLPGRPTARRGSNS